MAEYQQKDLNGILFKNDRKVQSNHPDYQGNCTIAGVQYWMSAWIKDGKEGRKFLSFAFKPKDDRQAQATHAAQTPVAQDMNDDIPFMYQWK